MERSTKHEGSDLRVMHYLVLDTAGGLLVLVDGRRFSQYLDYLRLVDGYFIIAVVIPFLNVDYFYGRALSSHAFDYALIFLWNTKCGIPNLTNLSLAVRGNWCPAS